MIKFFPIVLPILFILLFLSVFRNGFSKSNKILQLMDKKILEFKEKKFSSDNEKELAKQELKMELLAMKDNIRTGISNTATLALRQKAMNKILEIL